MKKRKYVVGFLSAIILAIFIISLFYLQKTGITGFAVFTQTSQGDFDLGTYINTTYNGTDVVLSGSNLTGNYTSKVFDASNPASWNNLTYFSLTPNVEFLFTADNYADVWKSSDGITWTLVKDDYNNGDGNGGTDMVRNSSRSLFILYNQDVWRSDDKGVTWTKVNDNYNGAEFNIGNVLGIDNNDALFIIEGDEDVWSSTDSGVSWNKVATNFNGANGNIFGISVNSSNAIFVVDGQADVWVSTDSGVTWTLVKDDYNGAVGNHATDMSINSSGSLFILDVQDVWVSTDSGVTWTLANDDFNGGGDSNSGIVIYTDENNHIYIIDGSEDVYKSTDSGATFSSVISNFNGANPNVFGLSSLRSYSNLTFQVRNCSSADCSDGAWQDADLNNINFQSRYFQYKVEFTRPSTSITPTLKNVRIDYTLINTAPTITLVSPSDGDAYGYGTGIKLNFSVSDADNNIDSCWYSIDSGGNIDLPGCLNTTFGISDGSHTIVVYVNDTLGEQVSDSASFSVQSGATTIILNSPLNNTYLNSQNVEFAYTATDIDLNYCELWGDFDGEFKLNQTHSPVSEIQDIFSLTLAEGTYNWNIRCYDTTHSAFNGNKTFYIDTISPLLTLTQPSGAKSSRTITASWTTQDASPISCKYNVYRGGNLEISNTSVDCSANTTSFSVSVDADFSFNFYIEDEARNKNSLTLQFNVDTSSPVIVSNGGGGGRRSESSITIIENKKEPNGVELKDLGDIIIYTGEKRTLQLEIKNNNDFFLNDCKITSKDKKIIESNEIKNIGAGEIAEFTISINSQLIQEEIPDIYLECTEKTERLKLNILLLQSELKIEILEMLMESKNKLLIKYTISSNNPDELELIFRVLDSNENQIAEQTEKVKIDGKEKQLILDISKAEKGMLKISIEKQDSEIGVEEFFVYNKNSLTGSAVNIINSNYTYTGLIILSFLIASFFIIRRIRRIIKYKKKRIK